MSKRERELDDEMRRLIAPFSEKEKTELFARFKQKKATFYGDFIEALKTSHYGPYMIEGEIGKARQAYYKSFYEELLMPGLAKHIISMYNVVRVNKDEEKDDSDVLMGDIFTRIYHMYLNEKVFLGHYLTHTNSLVVSMYDIHVIKYNHNEKNAERRELKIRYDDRGLLHFPENMQFKVQRPSESQCVSVVEYDDADVGGLFHLSFKGNLYNHLGHKERRFFDYKPRLGDYKEMGIKIKGLFAINGGVLLLTHNGKVYICGRGIDRLVSEDVVNSIKTGGYKGTWSQNEDGLSVDFFAPVKIDPSVDIVYVLQGGDRIVSPHSDVSVVERDVYLIDRSGKVYAKNLLANDDGFVLQAPQKCYISPHFPLLVLSDNKSGDNLLSKLDILETYDQMLITKDKRFFNRRTLKEIEISRFNFGVNTSYRDKVYQLAEFQDDNDKVLLFGGKKHDDDTHVIVVGLSNEKLYIFTIPNKYRYKNKALTLVHVIENDIPKNGKEDDLWKFQCDHCRTFMSMSTTFKDHAIDAKLCGQTCQNGLYLKRFNEVVNTVITNK